MQAYRLSPNGASLFFTAGLLIFTAWAAQAADEKDLLPVVKVPPAALMELRQIAIQHNGRVKPLDSFAWETVERLTGLPRFRGQDSVETVLSMVAYPSEWQEVPLLSVPFVPLREALGMGRKATHISYSELLATRKLMRMLPAIVEKQQRDEKLTMLENETMDLYDRFVLFTSLMKQELNLIPPERGQVWRSITQLDQLPPNWQVELHNAWEEFLVSLRQSDPSVIVHSMRRLTLPLRLYHPALPARWRIQLEVMYNHCAPFRIARFLYLAAALLFLLLAPPVRPARPGLQLPRRAGEPIEGRTPFVVRQAHHERVTCLFGTALAVHAVGILTRVVLGGRPPVSNFYETMLWLPFVGAVIALVFERIYRSGFFGLSGGILAAAILLLADHLPLDSSISPVVAVLRSNLWLTIHVLTIVGSYAPITLATVLAHLYGWFYLTRRERDPALASLSTFIYRALQVGVVMLAAGIMLGAVWANASWGRYWGWDPKETWALITLLWYLSLLHGRFAGWLKGVGVALGTIVGFFLLLMTYYGVSFYLVGLHSYAGGNAKPIPPLLVAYLLAEVAFIVAVGAKSLTLRRQIV